jgi:hypothetical protein
MKSVLLALALVLLPGICLAESRSIVVEVEKLEGGAVIVSIHSDDTSEKKANVTVRDATTILKEAKGFLSRVLVVIVVQNASVKDYKPLIDAIAENDWMELIEVTNPRRRDLAENILQNYGVEPRNKPDSQKTQ